MMTMTLMEDTDQRVWWGLWDSSVSADTQGLQFCVVVRCGPGGEVQTAGPDMLLSNNGTSGLLRRRVWKVVAPVLMVQDGPQVVK